MSRETSTITCGSRRPSSTSSEHSSSSSSISPTSSSASSSSSSLANLRIPIIRPFQRREVDLRRPARTAPHANSQTFIDLTDEPSSPPGNFVLPPERSPDHLSRRPPPRAQHQAEARPPPSRSQPQYIDLSDTEETHPRRPSSPEVQILSSRPRSRSLSLSNRRNAPSRRLMSPPHHRHDERLFPPSLPGFAELDFSTRVARTREELVGWQGFAGPEHLNIPNMLDFRSVGFDLDYPHHQGPQPRPPTYEAPPTPRTGFTRSPREDDYLACADCETELGIGEDEAKRQVWVNKPCGHVCVSMIVTVISRSSVIGLLRRMCGKGGQSE